MSLTSGTKRGRKHAATRGVLALALLALSISFVFAIGMDTAQAANLEKGVARGFGYFPIKEAQKAALKSAKEMCSQVSAKTEVVKYLSPNRISKNTHSETEIYLAYNCVNGTLDPESALKEPSCHAHFEEYKNHDLCSNTPQACSSNNPREDGSCRDRDRLRCISATIHLNKDSRCYEDHFQHHLRAQDEQRLAPPEPAPVRRVIDNLRSRFRRTIN